MADRYFLATSPVDDRAQLAGAEAQHLVRVMRASIGDEIVVFDGRGGEYLARIERVGRGDVELAILERRSTDRELPLAITLGVALPKGDRQRWLVEKSVELGVARIVPLLCERSVAQPGEASSDRLSRYVVEASKQCGRNRLLEIVPTSSFAAFAGQELPQAEVVRLAAHPHAQAGAGHSLREAIGPVAGGTCRIAWLAVGPEGGFSANEVSLLLEEGWCCVSLGPRVLRTETAALALVAALAAAQ